MTKAGQVSRIRVTVSGSFTKHWNEIQVVLKEFEKSGAEVLSPHNGPPLREEDGFVYFREDAGTAETIEKRHLRAIQQSDLLYVVNPRGYLGNSAALEIGYALAWHTSVWSSEPFGDLPHRLLVRPGGVTEALAAVGHKLGTLELPGDGTLDELQAYVKEMARTRGFSEETPAEIFILLVEEIGELAKAMRARLNLSMSSSDKSSKNIPFELADCLIYLLHLANQTGVNLFTAFRQKERLNAAKKWAKA